MGCQHDTVSGDTREHIDRDAFPFDGDVKGTAFDQTFTYTASIMADTAGSLSRVCRELAAITAADESLLSLIGSCRTIIGQTAGNGSTRAATTPLIDALLAAGPGAMCDLAAEQLAPCDRQYWSDERWERFPRELALARQMTHAVAGHFFSSDSDRPERLKPIRQALRSWPIWQTLAAQRTSLAGQQRHDTPAKPDPKPAELQLSMHTDQYHSAPPSSSKKPALETQPRSAPRPAVRLRLWQPVPLTFNAGGGRPHPAAGGHLSRRQVAPAMAAGARPSGTLRARQLNVPSDAGKKLQGRPARCNDPVAAHLRRANAQPTEQAAARATATHNDAPRAHKEHDRNAVIKQHVQQLLHKGALQQLGAPPRLAPPPQLKRQASVADLTDSARRSVAATPGSPRKRPRRQLRAVDPGKRRGLNGAFSAVRNTPTPRATTATAPHQQTPDRAGVPSPPSRADTTAANGTAERKEGSTPEPAATQSKAADGGWGPAPVENPPTAASTGWGSPPASIPSRTANKGWGSPPAPTPSKAANRGWGSTPAPSPAPDGTPSNQPGEVSGWAPHFAREAAEYAAYSASDADVAAIRAEEAATISDAIRQAHVHSAAAIGRIHEKTTAQIAAMHAAVATQKRAWKEMLLRVRIAELKNLCKVTGICDRPHGLNKTELVHLLCTSPAASPDLGDNDSASVNTTTRNCQQVQPRPNAYGQDMSLIQICRTTHKKANGSWKTSATLLDGGADSIYLRRDVSTIDHSANGPTVGAPTAVGFSQTPTPTGPPAVTKIIIQDFMIKLEGRRFAGSEPAYNIMSNMAILNCGINAAKLRAQLSSGPKEPPIVEMHPWTLKSCRDQVNNGHNVVQIWYLDEHNQPKRGYTATYVPNAAPDAWRKGDDTGPLPTLPPTVGSCSS